MNWEQKRRHNKKLFEQSERLLRRIRQSPKLWSDDTQKIDRVLVKAKARMIRRMMRSGAREWPVDRMLSLYA